VRFDRLRIDARVEQPHGTAAHEEPAPAQTGSTIGSSDTIGISLFRRPLTTGRRWNGRAME
jgi:hypothetical protein